MPIRVTIDPAEKRLVHAESYGLAPLNDLAP